ncbi:MAG: recombination protein RecR [Deltaproteobacteria bacterium]|nr:recombination protein RecR [Deltaproteobacteria bacterium]
MNGLPIPLERLIQELSKLPGIGEKTAGRLAFHMLKSAKGEVMALADSIGKLKNEISLCVSCFSLCEIVPGGSDSTECKVCQDVNRDKGVVCVVEEPVDVMAVERSGEFKGVYHVLHGAISPLDGMGPESLKIENLLTRIKNAGIREAILATNPTVAGEATALYLAKVIKPLGITVSRIARGLPMGGELEYTDAVTLSKALEGRKEI